MTTMAAVDRLVHYSIILGYNSPSILKRFAFGSWHLKPMTVFRASMVGTGCIGYTDAVENLRHARIGLTTCP